MKILLFARSFHSVAGGIEKMCLIIAQGLTQRGHIVIVVSLDSTDAIPFYKWPPKVVWEKISLGDASRKASNRTRVQRAVRLRKIAKKFDVDVAVGFQIGSFALLRVALCGLKIRTIAAERNAPTLYDYIKWGRTKRLASFLTLSTAHKVAILFPQFSGYYPRWLSKKIAHTPNPVNKPSEIRSNHNSSDDLIQLLFVGRLTYQKNLEVLLDALTLLEVEAQLTVIGNGPSLKACKEMASMKRLDVKFLDPVTNLESFLLRSDLLIMPSRWEGFPNVVAEALSCGLPVVGFQKCAGIPELISSGVNGYVCLGEMSAENLALGITQATKQKFNVEAVAKTVDSYTLEKAIDGWEQAML